MAPGHWPLWGPPPPPPPPKGHYANRCFHLMTSSCIIRTLTHVWFLFRIDSRVTDRTVGVLRRFLCRCGRNGFCGSSLFLAYISILLIAVLIVEATGPCISVQLRYVPAPAYRYNCDMYRPLHIGTIAICTGLCISVQLRSGPLLLPWFNLIVTWTSNYTNYNLWDKITYPFQTSTMQQGMAK